MISAAIEDYASGLGDLILASTAATAARLGPTVSANFAGGDFASGAMTLRQLITRDGPGGG
ncbi:hypothetical protein EFY87_13980 [Flexivirga caeni]|uniref:Uncharacterized protein n=2 Tax=Flexivirga caeni TaxID=2294115 RepID=A0A3M9M554_9MICO|nr:hypothetical protein EFY87_13980 [Flexivirga caeni]